MSKLLFSLLALLSIVSCGDNTNDTPDVPQPTPAQPALALRYQGKVYPAGSTIEILASERSFDYAPEAIEVVAGDDNEQFPSASPVIVPTTKQVPTNYTVSVNTTDFSRFTWCGVNGQCVPMGKASETRNGILTADHAEAPLLLECAFAAKQYAQTVATVQLSTANAPTANYTLRYVYRKP